METTTVPPVALSLIADTELTWSWVEGQTPVDFTQVVDGAVWSADFILLVCTKEISRTAMILSSDGKLSVTVPVATAARMKSCRRIDGKYQINITAPIPEMSEVWVGAVSVQEAVK